jgi:predicted transcriptional regulator
MVSTPKRREVSAEAPERLHTGELEARVMEVLWARGGWSTPGEVHEVIGADRPLAYTTTMTILVRLWKKERLERQRDGRAYAYRPLRTREEYAALGMNDLLAKVANRPVALAHFIDSLGTDERDQLRRMLQNPGAK